MSRTKVFVFPLVGFLLVLVALASMPAWALSPEEIALVVNSKVPASRKLAEFYAQARHIPAEHIIELSVDPGNAASPGEDIAPAQYDTLVAPVVRDFLTKNGLDKTVTCLVTFWGVPLRVDRRALDETEKKELTDLKSELEETRTQIEKQVQSTEALARQLDPEFKPVTMNDLDALAHRAEASLNAVLRGIPKVTDLKQRGEAYTQMMGLVRDLAGQPAVAEKLSQPDFWPLAPKRPTTDEIIAVREHTADLQKQVTELQGRPSTLETRAELRKLFKAELGSLNAARLLAVQTRATDVAESESALDSELALLWWPAYPKAKWEPNALNWHLAGRMQLPGHTLMVMRLDGPTEQSVHDLIETSVKVEKEGLRGEVVIDARGKPVSDPYGVYDQSLRNLGELLRHKTTLKIVQDNKESLIAENSEKDIAIYCGWYSLRHYVSPGQFNAGAVGFHVASSEMVSLHSVNETGWCRNLMNGGVVATLGPVAEPYLQSFPPADEFFPLLMTGKLSLAEVYWKTSPWSSWMQCCVGDPLYTPYKNNPAIKAEDLPEGLKLLVK